MVKTAQQASEGVSTKAAEKTPTLGKAERPLVHLDLGLNKKNPGINEMFVPFDILKGRRSSLIFLESSLR